MTLSTLQSRPNPYFGSAAASQKRPSRAVLDEDNRSALDWRTAPWQFVAGTQQKEMRTATVIGAILGGFIGHMASEAPRLGGRLLSLLLGSAIGAALGRGIAYLWTETRISNQMAQEVAIPPSEDSEVN